MTNTRKHNKISPRVIFDSLRREIITGAVASGTRLVEEEIAGKFHVSRTPVREALRMLREEGLLNLERGRGATVVVITRQDVIEIYQCIGCLYGQSARLAARQMTRPALEELEGILSSIQEAFEREDIDAFFNTNLQFFDAVSVVAGNRLIKELLDRLGSRVHRLRFMSMTIPGRMRLNLERRCRLYEALASRNETEAEQIAREGIEDSMNALLSTHYRSVPDSRGSSPPHALTRLGS